MANYWSHPLGVLTLVAHVLQCISAIVVLGITAWAVRETKTVTVIFSLVVATLTLVAFAVSTGISCIGRRRRWQILPIYFTDMALSYLWLTAFIFLALDFNRFSCRVNRWNGEIVCSRQYAAEAFSFIAFFVTLGSVLFQFFYAYTGQDFITRPTEDSRAEEQLSQNLEVAGVL
ncbi:hypothetical protein N7462_007618 [Penicillium macrosclerotiorum]|uniref:uncharacterized protein n=1 Tax=Penicillium macrosclerotiorum TaxID=303699 RepID=UPI0025497200|nr:uncharacterized protein N7462_007618 [Penicillium macrosclerotiorum]KAJ5679374.1 hypothetical protein N7462_007618 [Penicillium macrosclerotiorum]